MSIAHTILEQLGGNKFTVMTGAKNYSSTGSGEGIVGGLSFKLPSNFAKDGINCVAVYLTGLDTYIMKFWKTKRMDLVLLHEVNDVYAEDLQRIFKDTTGLDTHL